MIIFRYIAKEVFITLVALTTILLLIFMSNQFIQYLNRAANGQIPAMLLLQLMMLELPNLLVLLLPLGFYVAILVAYGRLYAESEMTVLQACGYSTNNLLKHTLIMASFIAMIVLIIIMWVSPIIMLERANVLRTTGIQTLIQTIVPGRFRDISNGSQIFYVESMSRDHKTAENIFLARQVEKKEGLQWQILWADKAFTTTEPLSNEDYVVLENGREYQGIPGKANYQIANFSSYKARLPHPKIAKSNDVRAIPFTQLLPFNNTDLKKAAELQWRFSVPLMVFTLALVAVPLSRVNPRSGKYSSLLPALVLYILYANSLFISRDWLMSGKIPLWLGMLWPHIVVISIGIFLIYRSQKNFT